MTVQELINILEDLPQHLEVKTWDDPYEADILYDIVVEKITKAGDDPCVFVTIAPDAHHVPKDNIYSRRLPMA